MSVFKRAAVLTASIATAAAVTTGCSAYGNSAAAPAAAGTTATTSTAPTSPRASSNAGAANSGSTAGTALIAAASTSLGKIVTNASGLTLYRFDKDTAKPPTSNCSGACATAWPPATVANSVSLSGIDKSLVGAITRADGTKQLTLNGWPLYTYAGDGKPGDINGQGVGGTWYAVTPTGGKAKASAAGSNSGSGSQGYGDSTSSSTPGGW